MDIINWAPDFSWKPAPPTSFPVVHVKMLMSPLTPLFLCYLICKPIANYLGWTFHIHLDFNYFLQQPLVWPWGKFLVFQDFFPGCLLCIINLQSQGPWRWESDPQTFIPVMRLALCCWMTQHSWPALYLYFLLFQSFSTSFSSLESLSSFSLQSVALVLLLTWSGLTKFLFHLAFGLLFFSINVENKSACLKQFKAPTKKWNESIKKIFRNNLNQDNHYLPWKMFFIFLRVSSTKQKTFFFSMPFSLQFEYYKKSH